MSTPIDRAIANMPAILRAEALKARKRSLRWFVENYDRRFSLPRVLLGHWADADAALAICAADRETILSALRRAIRHHRKLCMEHRWYASRPALESARKVYAAERYEALKARATLKMMRAA
jgi:hypothetical protein